MFISCREAFLGKRPMRSWPSSDSNWIVAADFDDSVWSEEFLRIKPDIAPDDEITIRRFFSIEHRDQIVSEGASSFSYQPEDTQFSNCRILYNQERDLYILNFEYKNHWAPPLEENLKKWISEKSTEEIEEILARGRYHEDIKTMGLE